MNKRNNPETQQINSHSVEQRTHSSREKVTMSNDDSDNETEIKTTETTSPQKDEPSLEIKKDSTEASAEPEKPSSDDEDSKIEALNEAKAKEDAEKTAKEAEEERKRKDELRKKYANWPLRAIKDPHDNDVMYGRGGGTNHHHGNKTYRKLVENRKLEYVNSKRLDKPLVALEIIRLWRAQLPPGRFLKLDEKTGLWNDVGDKKAREKTSQALREKAPLIRKQQEEEKGIEDGEKSAEVRKCQVTRFSLQKVTLLSHNIFLLYFHLKNRNIMVNQKEKLNQQGLPQEPRNRHLARQQNQCLQEITVLAVNI
jgi:hypothetical protein